MISLVLAPLCNSLRDRLRVLESKKSQSVLVRLMRDAQHSRLRQRRYELKMLVCPRKAFLKIMQSGHTVWVIDDDIKKLMYSGMIETQSREVLISRD